MIVSFPFSMSAPFSRSSFLPCGDVPPSTFAVSEKMMEKSAGKNPQLCGKKHARLRESVREAAPDAWARLFRAVHPIKTAERVAVDIAASPRTVENWMNGAAAPSLMWFLRILACYGPEVLAVFLPESCGWLAAARRAERQMQLEAEHARLSQEISALRRVH